jgi:predicted phosphate transport protein (TIGR00153 family)
MGLNHVFQFLVPKDKKFPPLFQRAASNLVEASVLLKQLIGNYETGNVDEIVKKINEKELEGDKITRMIYDEINHTFITPFDREDIHRLAKNIDEVVDLINRINQDISLYKPKSLLQSFVDLAAIIHSCAVEIEEGMKYVGEHDGIGHLMNTCTKINELESTADEINHKAISSLFKKEKDPIELIKLKDILSSLERAVDRTERVADILKVVIVKMV